MVFEGALMFTFVPSMAPGQFGKFHLIQNAEVMSLHICSMGLGNWVSIICLAIARQVMCMWWTQFFSLTCTGKPGWKMFPLYQSICGNKENVTEFLIISVG